jgi:putative redox protein
MTPSRKVKLAWTGDGLAFRGGAPNGPEVVVDGGSEVGPSPMDFLLLSLAGCMGVDVRVILEKSRVPVEELEVEIEGERAERHPKRYTGIRLIYRIAGPDEEHEGRVQRAVDLSREKFCSVLHSLRPDIDVEIEIQRA